MMVDIYFTISAPSEGLYKDRGSRFISFAYPVYSETEIKQYLHELKKKYYDARHHCYACRLGVTGELWRAADDGEPSGSAGKPILGQLLSNNLTNIVVFVVRYFGGIKLGVPGLINAYRSASSDAIRNATIIEMEDKDGFSIEFNYLATNSVMKIIKEEQPEIVKQEFDTVCRIDLRIRRSLSESLKNKLLLIENEEVKI
ncbi:MAG: YigZ family protein, partial [Prevotellaceae bacterium]|nr:YigZ family protein [Prevotellaceae bacterium]